eukprot:Opistho-2@79834
MDSSLTSMDWLQHMSVNKVMRPGAFLDGGSPHHGSPSTTHAKIAHSKSSPIGAYQPAPHTPVRQSLSMGSAPAHSVSSSVQAAAANAQSAKNVAPLVGLGEQYKFKMPPEEFVLTDKLPEGMVIGENGKPAYSYATLIAYAINDVPDRKLTLNEIYKWIIDKFPYYKDAGNGWKVCIVCAVRV